MKAENIQVAGNHYKTMAYQTARFGFDVGLESLGTQIAKYLTRDKGSRIENLEKAYHCICLDQQFDEEWKLEEGDYCLDIYYEHDDEPCLEKYFSQFPDGDKLKSIMRQYMKANYPQAKGLLRKYINSLALFKKGDVVVKVCAVNSKFSTGLFTAIVDKVDMTLNRHRVYFKHGGWLYADVLKKVVAPKSFSEATHKVLGLTEVKDYL